MKKLLLIFTFLIFLPSFTFASFVSLTTSIQEIVIENRTQTYLEITNSGDEMALSLSISLILPDGFYSDKIFLDKLNSNSTFRGTLNITRIKELAPGRYPAVVLIEYTDVNSYPFSAISPAILIYTIPTFSKIYGSISGLSLKGKNPGKLTLNLKNLDDVEHEVRIRLFLPRELKSEETEKSILLKSKEEKNLEFKVSNFAALPGSKYIVIASIEYEDKLHYSSLASGIVKIDVGNSINKIPLTLVAILSLVSLIIIVAIYFMK